MRMWHMRRLKSTMSSRNEATPINQRIHEGEYVGNSIEHAETVSTNRTTRLVWWREAPKGIGSKFVPLTII